VERTDSLDAVFDPASVAIAGVASTQEGLSSPGQRYVDYLLQYGFKGKIYPLHPKGGEFCGLPVYANIKEVPGPVDQLISCIPAARVKELITDCAARGVKAVVLHTAGFSETGREEGRQLEAEVVRLAQAGSMRIVGPNCMGAYHPKAGLSIGYDLPCEGGRMALICQSGSNAIFLIRAAAERGVRFSKVISYGNACDIDESDLMEYFVQDSETDMVAAYIEGVKDGRRFREVIHKLSAVKPVVVLKAGCGPAGQRATASHTGSLAGSDTAWNAILSQANVIRVYSLNELVDMMVALQFMRAPQGNRVVILGVGGGVSVLATDECSAAGFVVPPLPPEIKQELSRAIASDAGAMLSNPIDFPFWLSGEEKYREILRSLLEWEGIDLFLFLAPLRHTELELATYLPILDYQLNNIIKVAAGSSKPMAVVIDYLATGESWLAASGVQRRCYEAGLPVYHSTASAFKAVARLCRYRRSAQNYAMDG